MDLLRTGSSELVYIQTDKVCVAIKGKSAHLNSNVNINNDCESVFKVFCNDPYYLSQNEVENPFGMPKSSGTGFGIYTLQPLFFEQQNYEIVIEGIEGHKVTFWHDNINIRNKITRASRKHELLSGVINFGNEIGFSDLVISLDDQKYLRLVVEVFPSKISYKDDYKRIVMDVTQEVYNVVFDFLKKTYSGYKQSDRTTSSPVEFFAVITKIYDDLIRATDMILVQPHHLLETMHEVLPSHKIKKIDNRTLRWLSKHSDQTKVTNETVSVTRALAVKKQITYDTKENRLTKHILKSTSKKLLSFKRNYLNLQRLEDQTVIEKIDSMIEGINRRSNISFLKDVSAHEVSTGMSLVFSMAPGYRDLYKYYLMLLRGLSITGDIFNISIKDLAVLYEYWCFIKLNSIMKERYELVSQDIIKVLGNGLFVSLVKGRGSLVKYRNPNNDETIVLSYNPRAIDVPTISQRPDNVLTLEKKGTDVQYEYVFDAKYRINPAIPGTDYYNLISHNPGPETDDINNMHRYRDAIVYQNGAAPYERSMFGAYVLFPYDNEEEYRQHRFYKSIGKVNIGGLPFLPAATNLVSEALDELISDSPDSAFERTTLPRGIEKKLKRIDWSVRDVMVGGLSNREQFDTCINGKFYHIPANKISDNNLPIRYIAIYQSKKLFNKESGIHYYGAVTTCSLVKRKHIVELPSISDELYYRFGIKEWLKLSKPIAPKELRFINIYTNLFLLLNSSDIPELQLRSEEEYRLYSELKRAAIDTAINDEGSNVSFKFKDSVIVFENDKIYVYRQKRICAKYEASDFSRWPGATFRRLKKDVFAAL